ncbi:hypothetical protein JL720_7797 [Aureococcus anophagefferens]|nr:hypothetical protein JL720_7797 [Aureococcus anophagefferens]
MAQGSDGFCGDERGRFECLFLPWNRCPTRATVERLDGEAARRGDAKRRRRRCSGRRTRTAAAVFGSAAASLCDKSTPLFARCPPHSSLCGDPPRQPRERRLTLLHRALWDRPAWRLRNATAAEERAFYDRAPSFRAAAAAGRCAFVHIRHGDKLYDRWLRIHKTRSFAVDLPQYVSEALPLLGLLGSERPHEVLLMSDDGDMVADAAAVAGVARIHAAPASLGAVSSHCRKSDQRSLLRPAPRPGLRCSEKLGANSGDWKRGVGELARILASLRLAAKCDAVVHNYESSFVHVLWRDACSRRGPRGCQLSFSFGSQEASTAAATNAKLGRTCAQPATPEAVRKEYGTGRRTCDPPSPPVPGPTFWSDAAEAFFRPLEARAREQEAGG